MTETALATRRGAVPVPRQEFTGGQIELIKNAIMPGANDAELALFIEYARRTGLDPLARQLVPIKTWDKDQHRYRWEFMTGIDGLRLVAQRTGEYDGTEGPFFREKGGDWHDYWDGDKPPHECKVVVFRKGASRGFSGRVKFEEFVRRNRQGQPYGNWASHPEHMLAVRAESHALRRGFPRETSGLYVDYDEDGRRIPRQVHIVNPDAPASDRQKGELVRLARELGWLDEERHERAGVSSFKDLTKGRASELIDKWSALADTNVEDGEIAEQIQAGDGDQRPPPVEEHPGSEVTERDVGYSAASGTAPEQGEPERPEPSVPDASLEGPATEGQWENAVALCGSRAKVTFLAHDMFGVNSADDITATQMAELIRAGA